MTLIKYKVNKMPKSEDKYLSLMAASELNIVREFHQSFPQYEKTPLVKLKEMAKSLGVKNIYVKDESYRFGLNAFKVLGGSYAMAKHISKELGHEEKVLSFAELASDQLREKIGQTTFFTATDGNHVDVFTAISDDITAKGMRMLAKPLGNDKNIVSGESGAAPFGLLATVLDNESYEELKELIKIDEESEILLFSTEGDTDPDRYRGIVF